MSFLIILTITYQIVLWYHIHLYGIVIDQYLLNYNLLPVTIIRILQSPRYKIAFFNLIKIVSTNYLTGFAIINVITYVGYVI